MPLELCIYHYAKATLDFCRKANAASLKEIHFVDIKSDNIFEIQKMFDLMVNDGKDPGYDTNKFVKGQGSRWGIFSLGIFKKKRINVVSSIV